MSGLLRTIDELLRGRLTRTEDLAAGRIEIPARTLTIAGLVLGAAHGIIMGLYAPMRAENPSLLQLLATTAKVPPSSCSRWSSPVRLCASYPCCSTRS